MLGFKYQLLPLMESFQFIVTRSAFTTILCTEIGNEGLDKLWWLWEKRTKKERRKAQRKERNRKRNKFIILRIRQ
jgi:hypothetical protein